MNSICGYEWNRSKRQLWDKHGWCLEKCHNVHILCWRPGKLLSTFENEKSCNKYGIISGCLIIDS
jgi:hypothetical protein